MPIIDDDNSESVFNELSKEAKEKADKLSQQPESDPKLEKLLDEELKKDGR
jgi:hypothetical protein